MVERPNTQTTSSGENSSDDTTLLCPGWSQLREYQKTAATRLTNRQAVGLWVATGLGKTATILAAWSQYPATPVLVVTQAVGRHVWARDAVWVLGPDVKVATLWGGKKRSKYGRHRDGTYSDMQAALDDGASFIVTNYEILHKRFDELVSAGFQYVIFDEAHALKGGYLPTATKRDGSKQRKRYYWASGLAQEAQLRGGIVWEATATPVRDRVRDLWGQLATVLPGEFGTSWHFLHRYCGAFKNEWGGLDSTGSTNQQELRDRVLSHFVVLRRDEVADELPDIQRDIRVVTPDARRKIPQLMGGGVEEALERAAEVKIPVVVELCIDYLSAGSKVAVVTNRRKTAGQIAETLAKATKRQLSPKRQRNIVLQTVSGMIAVRHRIAVVKKFNEMPGAGALTATMDSIMTSIDLHKIDGLIFAALPYTPYQAVQMEGRVARLGGCPCTIHYLVAEGTIDGRVKDLVLDKLDSVEKVGTDTQGAGGIAEAFSKMYDSDKILGELRSWLNA